MSRVTNAQTHGHVANGRRSPTYNSWRAMIERCTRERHPFYPAYGGRGIQVDERWRGRGGFSHFLTDVGERPLGMTLDRINVDGHYVPDNVRWATPRTQRLNRRDFVQREEETPEHSYVSSLYPMAPATVTADIWPF